MKAPFIILAAALTCGIVADYFMSWLPTIMVIGVLIVGIPVLWTLRGMRAFGPLLFLLIACLGFLDHRLSLEDSTDHLSIWTKNLSWVALEGTVKNPPEIKKNEKRVSLSFVLRAKKLIQGSGRKRQSHEVSGDVQVFISYPPVRLPEVGDRVRLWGTLNAPKPAMNGGGFNYRAYLARRSIYAVFYGYGAKAFRIVESGKAYDPLRLIYRLRNFIACKIEEQFASDLKEAFKATLIGIRRGLSPELWDDLVKTGTAHLIAISGLQISIIAGSSYAVFLWLGLGQKQAALSGLFFVFVYVYLGGTGVPLQRAGLTAAVMFAGILLERQNHFLNALAIAYLILLWVNPKSLMDLSFQLSFLSVLSLVIFIPFFRSPENWKQGLRQSVAVLAGTLPLILYHFNIFSPVSIVANLLAIPLFNFALLGGWLALLLHFVPGLGMAVTFIAELSMRLTFVWIHWLAGWPGGYFYLKSPEFLHLIIYYLSLAGVVTFQKLKLKRSIPVWWRGLSMGIYFLAVSAFFIPGNRNDFRFTLLSAGKNEIYHFQFSNGPHWLINAGRGGSSDQGRMIVLPYIKSRGIQSLEGILLTDSYKKHSGALEAILRNANVRYLIHPPMREILKSGRPFARKIKFVSVEKDYLIRGEQKDEFLHILEIVKGKSVILLKAGDWSFLILPSVEPEIGKVLERHRELLLDVDVLALPALPKNLNPDFLKFLSDRLDPLAVLSPAPQEQARIYCENRDIAFINSEENGALSISIAATQLHSPMETDELLTKSKNLVIHSQLRGPIKILA